MERRPHFLRVVQALALVSGVLPVATSIVDCSNGAYDPYDGVGIGAADAEVSPPIGDGARPPDASDAGLDAGTDGEGSACPPDGGCFVSDAASDATPDTSTDEDASSDASDDVSWCCGVSPAPQLDEPGPR